MPRIYDTPVSVRTIRNAIEASLDPSVLHVYLSHPITTGDRSVDENVASAAKICRKLRGLALPCAVVNPAVIGHIPGWDHDRWMEMWLPFIRNRVGTLVLGPEWQLSTGCQLEFECARDSDVRCVDFEGFVRQQTGGRPPA